VVLMFKIMVLQSLYNLSDAKTEFEIRDRITFMQFLNLGLGDAVPDEKTIWLFREDLKRLSLNKPLFDRFDRFLNQQGYYAQKGSIVDASIVEAPKQCNMRDENAQIKQGETPASFVENPNRNRQKDIDARWVNKRGCNYYGYKNHVNADAKHKFIRQYEVTAAAVHDGQMLEALLDPDNTNGEVYGDSAYCSEKNGRLLAELNYRDRIHRKGYRGHPLSDCQQAAKPPNTKTRVRAEQVFGRLDQLSVNPMVRTIGLIRAKVKISLRNLVYNLDRYAMLRRRCGYT
jgi:IS5 family transposase